MPAAWVSSPRHGEGDALSPSDLRAVQDLLKRHVRLTGSRIARAILRDERRLAGFRRIATYTR